MYIISHTFRNSSLDYEQTIRKLNLGVNCLMYLPVHEQQRLGLPWACLNSFTNIMSEDTVRVQLGYSEGTVRYSEGTLGAQ